MRKKGVRTFGNSFRENGVCILRRSGFLTSKALDEKIQDTYDHVQTWAEFAYQEKLSKSQ